MGAPPESGSRAWEGGVRHVRAPRARSRRVGEPSGGSLGLGALTGVAVLAAGVSRGRISQFGETRPRFGGEAAW